MDSGPNIVVFYREISTFYRHYSLIEMKSNFFEFISLTTGALQGRRRQTLSSTSDTFAMLSVCCREHSLEKGTLDSSDFLLQNRFGPDRKRGGTFKVTECKTLTKRAAEVTWACCWGAHWQRKQGGFRNTNPSPALLNRACSTLFLIVLFFSINQDKIKLFVLLFQKKFKIKTTYFFCRVVLCKRKVLKRRKLQFVT